MQGKFSELLERIDTTYNDVERDDEGDRTTERWEHLVKTTASIRNREAVHSMQQRKGERLPSIKDEGG